MAAHTFRAIHPETGALGPFVLLDDITNVIMANTDNDVFALSAVSYDQDGNIVADHAFGVRFTDDSFMSFVAVETVPVAA